MTNSFNQQMKKNGLLQTYFYDYLKIQVTNYGSFEEMKKGTSAMPRFFLSKRAWRHEKGAWLRAILFFCHYTHMPQVFQVNMSLSYSYATGVSGKFTDYKYILFLHIYI